MIAFKWACHFETWRQTTLELSFVWWPSSPKFILDLKKKNSRMTSRLEIRDDDSNFAGLVTKTLLTSEVLYSTLSDFSFLFKLCSFCYLQAYRLLEAQYNWCFVAFFRFHSNMSFSFTLEGYMADANFL